jgi:hypothetical protein
LNSKLTANESYRITGVRYRRRPLGGVGESRQGVEGEKTGDGISYAAHVKNANSLKARATTFYDPVHHALDKEAKCAWKEGEGNHWPSVYIQKPFMTL